MKKIFDPAIYFASTGLFVGACTAGFFLTAAIQNLF